MGELLVAILFAGVVGFISYNVGKEDQRNETCEASGGIVSKGKCYFHMEEKKEEMK